jgi:hypothetical protein
MRPTQLSPQCGDNCLIRECLSELHHAAQVFVGEAAAKLGYQLSRHRGDNLFPIGRPFRSQDFVPDALADLPIKSGEAKVDGYRGLAPGLDDQATHIFKERCDWGRDWNEFTHTQSDYQAQAQSAMTTSIVVGNNITLHALWI